jgi:DNA-binding MarR family transcriptional regulator
MSLENDIQQSSFRNEYHKLVVNLTYTYNWSVEQNRKFFESANLTSQQYNILRILRGAKKPLSTFQIRERMLDRMSDTSRIVDRLVKKGLVQKVVSMRDRRLVDVTITEAGLQLLADLDKLNDSMDEKFKNLTEDEAKMLNRLLDKLRRSE